MKLFRKIDTDGYFVEDVIINDEDKIDLHIDIDIPSGLYKPRFVNGSWMDAISDEDKKIKTNAILISNLNNNRDEELKFFVIQNIAMNESLLKTMFTQYSFATDSDTLVWIDINNNQVDFTKDEFGLLIQSGMLKVKDIYFSYRQQKDDILNGSN